MKAKELKPGDSFKWDKSQRKFRQVSKVIVLEKAHPGHNEAGDLLILIGCRQLVLDPDAEVIVQEVAPVLEVNLDTPQEKTPEEIQYELWVNECHPLVEKYWSLHNQKDDLLYRKSVLIDELARIGEDIRDLNVDLLETRERQWFLTDKIERYDQQKTAEFIRLTALADETPEQIEATIRKHCPLLYPQS